MIQSIVLYKNNSESLLGIELSVDEDNEHWWLADASDWYVGQATMMYVMIILDDKHIYQENEASVKQRQDH